MNHKVRKLIIGICAVLLVGCGSHKPFTDNGLGKGPFAPESYVQVIEAKQTPEQNLTAKVKVTIQMGEKSISTSGMLRMKKNDVIQLSLVDPLLGIAEIGRMEFTRLHVLIIDRFNKQYIDVPYDEVSFLKRANIDFFTLQALFWNQVFEPGQPTVDASHFTFTNNEGNTPKNKGTVLMTYQDKLLNYMFQTLAPNGTLQRTAISSNRDDSAQFAFDYAKFGKFEHSSFPREMTMSFVMGQRQASLHFSLSSLHNNSDWNARTPIPSKYKKADPEKIFNSLVR